MFAYQIVLAHVERSREVVLRLIADWHYATVTELLRREGLSHEYRDWSILSFQVVPLCEEAAARARAWRTGRRTGAARERPRPKPHRASPERPAARRPAARAPLGSLVDTQA
jgi:hypothetical protein